MKNITKYLPFPIAFIIITALLIYLNSQYTNIFKFDFSKASSKMVSLDSSTAKKDSHVKPKLTGNDIDSSKPVQKITLINSTTPTVPQHTVSKPQNNNLADENKVTPPKVQTEEKPTETQKVAENNQSSDTVAQNESEPDTLYEKWVKQTAMLYDSMDPQKAAQIIKQYNDKTSRDIIYTMKKKKAAEILTYLDPVTANKIVQYRR